MYKLEGQSNGYSSACFGTVSCIHARTNMSFWILQSTLSSFSNVSETMIKNDEYIYVQSNTTYKDTHNNKSSLRLVKITLTIRNYVEYAGTSNFIGIKI